VKRRPVRRLLAPGETQRARLRRRWMCAALASLALTGLVALPAISANADTGNIMFDAISGDGTGNMSVTVTSDDPLGSITVNLLNGSSQVLATSDFTEQGTFSPGSQQTWTLNNPATDLAALAPGIYAVTLNVTDADGDQTVTGLTPSTGPDTFTLDGQPSITLGPATSPTTSPGQSFNLSGQVNIFDPLTGTTGGFGGQSVTISQQGSTNQWTTTTNSQGSYTVAVTGNPGNTYVASVAVTSFSPTQSSTGTVQDVAQYAPTSLTATVTGALYGHQEISGTLTYQTAGFTSTTAPSGVTITATSGSDKITTTTDANGDFSMTLPPLIGTNSWTLATQNETTSNPFLAATQTEVGATQLWPDALTGLTVSIDRSFVLTVGGCLARTISTPPASPDYPRVDLEYRTSRSGTWTVFGTVTTAGKLADCSSGAGFLAQGTAPAGSAFYRAYFPGDGAYEPATSSTTGRVWKYITRFRPFGATPDLVVVHGKITVSGTLQEDTTKWRAYANQRVLLIYSMNWSAEPQDQVWYAFGWVRTNSTGHFSKTFADPVRRGAGWSANFDGNGTHFVVSAPIRVVRVRHAVSPDASNAPASASGGPAKVVSRVGSEANGPAPSWPYVLVDQPLEILMGPQP
jgi:hypothetical protein